MRRINNIRGDFLEVRNRVDEPSRPIHRGLVGLELGTCPLSYQSTGSGNTAIATSISFLPTPVPAAVVAR